MIKQVLENAVADLEAQKASALQSAQATAIREKVNPFNAEIDESYQKAVSELALKFESDKHALLEAGNKKKLEHQEQVLSEVTNATSYKYDLAVAKLKKQITELGE